METVDFGAYFVVYDLIVGVLLMVASEKVGVYAGYLGRGQRATVARITRIATFTFGATVAVLAGSIYLFFHLLKLGV